MFGTYLFGFGDILSEPEELNDDIDQTLTIDDSYDITRINLSGLTDILSVTNSYSTIHISVIDFNDTLTISNEYSNIADEIQLITFDEQLLLLPTISDIKNVDDIARFVDQKIVTLNFELSADDRRMLQRFVYRNFQLPMRFIDQENNIWLMRFANTEENRNLANEFYRPDDLNVTMHLIGEIVGRND